MKRRKKTKRVRKAKKRKMIRILTPPKLNLVNRNASNNKESINDFIEHFDTIKSYTGSSTNIIKTPKFLVKRKYFKKILSSETEILCHRVPTGGFK